LKPVAAFAAAVSAAAIILGIEFFVGSRAAGDDLHLSVAVFLIAAMLSLMFGIPAAALGGVPILLALRSRHIESARAFAAAGAVLALTTYLVVAGTGLWRPEYQSLWWHVSHSVIGMLAGSAGAFIYWLLAVR
jgi:hypothetical protein